MIEKISLKWSLFTFHQEVSERERERKKSSCFNADTHDRASFEVSDKSLKY